MLTLRALHAYTRRRDVLSRDMQRGQGGEGVDFGLRVNTPLTVTLIVLRCLARSLEVNEAVVQCSGNRVQNCH